MEDFKLVKNNLFCGFISYDEFVTQWDKALRNHGMAFSFEIESKLDEIKKEYGDKLRQLTGEILERQGWLAD